MKALAAWTHLLLWISLALAVPNRIHGTTTMVWGWTYAVCSLFFYVCSIGFLNPESELTACMNK